MKKFIAILLLTAIIAGIFCACGASSTKYYIDEIEWNEDENVPIKLTVRESAESEPVGFIITDETKITADMKLNAELKELQTSKEYRSSSILQAAEYLKITEGEFFEDDGSLKWYCAEAIKGCGYNEMFGTSEKPVIYLYPEEETAVSVKLALSGRLTCAYPAYNGGWRVTAAPDGTLTDDDGMEYNYLYWEGISAAEHDFSTGFCVAGSDTAEFLEKALAELGLSRREANEFIVYWLPRMEQNAYNLISFQGTAYTESAKLDITPAPDTVIRVFMAWKPLDEAVEIPPQSLPMPERSGFTVVEWGGTEIK